MAQCMGICGGAGVLLAVVALVILLYVHEDVLFIMLWRNAAASGVLVAGYLPVATALQLCSASATRAVASALIVWAHASVILITFVGVMNCDDAPRNQPAAGQ